MGQGLTEALIHAHPHPRPSESTGPPPESREIPRWGSELAPGVRQCSVVRLRTQEELCPALTTLQLGKKDWFTWAGPALLLQGTGGQ